MPPIAVFSMSVARRAASGLLLIVLAACATPPPVATGPVGTTFLADRAALPFDDAVVQLAEATLAGARNAAPAANGRPKLVIDPLIDRATGQENAATRSMVARIETVIRERYPELELVAFTPENLDAKPLILLGAITPSAGPGNVQPATGPTVTWRIWAVLGDLRTGKILSHPVAWVRGETLDPTPVAFFRDSPAWVDDEIRTAYLRTCAGNPGDPIDPTYLAALRAQAETASAIKAYEAGQPERALALYVAAATRPGGKQSRVLNGVYLANQALGRTAAAEAAFGELVEYGLARDRLAVKLLFRPGSAGFVREPAVSGPYPMWLRQIATRAAARQGCLRVAGHASVSGPASVNDRLSRERAEAVRKRLDAEKPALNARTRAEGFGARQPIIGLGTDDLRDALDRRVEFAPIPCAGLTASAGGIAG